MRTITEPHARHAIRWLALAGLVFASLALTSRAAATTPTVDPSLRGEVLESYEVLEVHDGLLLRAKAAGGVVQQIELPDDERDVALLNGKEFDRQELAAWLGADAPLIARLLDLDGEERRVALGLATAEESEVETEPERTTPSTRRHRISSDDRLVFGGSVKVEPNETAQDVVVIGGSADVQGEVLGSVVVVGGSSTISGKVLGDVVCVGGSIHLLPTAEVMGEAVSIGAGVRSDPGAKVLGKISQVSIGEAILKDIQIGKRRGHDIELFKGDDRRSEMADVVWGLVRMMVLMLLGCLVALVAHRPFAAAAERVVADFWKASLVGLAAWLLFIPLLILVCVILAVSIIGIPLLLLVPFAVLTFLLAAFVGYVAVAYTVGRLLAERFGWSVASPLVPVVLGVASLQGLSIVADLFGLPGGPFSVFEIVIGLTGFLVKFVAWMVGTGAALLAWYGRRREGSPIPLIPPIPPTPPTPIVPPEPAPEPSGERWTAAEPPASADESEIDTATRPAPPPTPES